MSTRPILDTALATTVTPVLLACSHGTSSSTGRRAIAALVDAVARHAPQLHVAAAFVDVQQPDVPTRLASLGTTARIVPLLLSAGYHVHVDLAAAVAARPGTTLAGTLGPDPRLADLLARRLREAGLRAEDAVVLAAAGSSDPAAVADCRRVGRLLAARLGRTVTTAFLSAAEPRLAETVAQVRARLTAGRGRVVVATYLLAPGYFADLVAGAGADLCTPPLLTATEPPPAELVEVVLDRYTLTEQPR